MDNAKKAKALKANTDVLEATFEKRNLRLLGFTVRPHELRGKDADFAIICEVASIEGSSIDESAEIKINLYDNDGDLYAVEEHYIWESEFEGYDSFEINVYLDDEALNIIKSMRIYATKG